MCFKHFYAHTFGEIYKKFPIRIDDGTFITQISKESSSEGSLTLDPIVTIRLSRYREDPTSLGLGFPEVLRERDISDNNKSGDTHSERGREGGLMGVG
jgi:hypothetical protein